MEEPSFWDNPERSNQKMKELKNMKDTVSQFHELETQKDDILTLIEMANEENDESLVPEVLEEYASFQEVFEKLRISTLLSEEYDKPVAPKRKPVSELVTYMS